MQVDKHCFSENALAAFDDYTQSRKIKKYTSEMIRERQKKDEIEF